LRQLIPLSSANRANPCRCCILLCEISCELAGCMCTLAYCVL
jgi:hypothetical protein